MTSSLIDSNSLIVLRCSAGISACSSASGSSLTPVGHLEAGENEMMRASVDIVGHGIGIALLLRRAGRARQVADDRLYRPVAMKHDASDVMLAVRSARRPIRRFDDVASAAEVEKGLPYSAGFKALCAGRTCARPVRWRTIRAMTTTRRPGDREARDSAARRPRPKVERPGEPPLRLNVWLRWPAFFAAASPRQRSSSVSLAPWLP